MAYSKREKTEKFWIDIEKLETLMKERGLSQRKLCRTIGKSHSWFANIKREAKTEAVSISLLTAQEIASALNCYIQNFRCDEPPAWYKHPYKEPFHQPFKVDGRDLAHKSIDKMNDHDLSIIGIFLCEITEMDNTMASAKRGMADKNCEAKERACLQRDYEKAQKKKDDLMWFLSRYFVRPEITDIVKSISEKTWWINIFLWTFRSKMEQLQLYIPTNSELECTYTDKLKRDSDGKITDASKKEAEEALEYQLKLFIKKVINRMEDEDGTWNEIAKQCTKKLSEYFLSGRDY